jgi:hypothetical protein
MKSLLLHEYITIDRGGQTICIFPTLFYCLPEITFNADRLVAFHGKFIDKTIYFPFILYKILMLLQIVSFPIKSSQISANHTQIIALFHCSS